MSSIGQTFFPRDTSNSAEKCREAARKCRCSPGRRSISRNPAVRSTEWGRKQPTGSSRDGAPAGNSKSQLPVEAAGGISRGIADHRGTSFHHKSPTSARELPRRRMSCQPSQDMSATTPRSFGILPVRTQPIVLSPAGRISGPNNCGVGRSPSHVPRLLDRVRYCMRLQRKCR